MFSLRRRDDEEGEGNFGRRKGGSTCFHYYPEAACLNWRARKVCKGEGGSGWLPPEEKGEEGEGD